MAFVQWKKEMSMNVIYPPQCILVLPTSYNLKAFLAPLAAIKNHTHTSIAQRIKKKKKPDSLGGEKGSESF